MIEQPERLWEPDEVAAYLGVPVKTLYAWRHNGRGPQAIRVGRHLRWKRETIEDWLKSQAIPKPA